MNNSARKKLAYNIGRPHTDFVNILPMTAEEYKGKNKPLQIYYAPISTPIGKLFVANTGKGICYVSFYSTKKEGADELIKRYPNAEIIEKVHKRQDQVKDYFSQDWSYVKPLTLHIKGTPFQHKVWASLLEIPFGKITTYGGIAQNIGKKRAYLAVGRAAASNPIMFFIPCHRLIKANGKLGGYYWGIDNKIRLLNIEMIKNTKIKGYSTWQPTMF